MEEKRTKVLLMVLALGLREAVTQVLQRHYYAPDLRLRVLSAPMMHRQKATTPFGDISTLAKGRLYATAGGGFEFVQEDDDRGCGPCPRCNRVVCEDIYTEDPTHLLALWTVKRLRHRTHHGGFNYETEYTVSPVDDVNEAIRDGRFDYSLPGHVFVIKQKEAQGSTFPETYNKKIPTDLFKPDVIIGIDNYGNKHVLKTYHPFFTSPTQQQPVTTPPENPEIELYKVLLKTLASKTSTTPSQEGPFRVSLNHYIPPPLPSSPTSPGAETKPPKQADNVGDVTQPVKTTVHYFMPVGEVLMTTKKMEGSTTKTTAATEKSKTTKKPSLLSPKNKTPVIPTPRRPTIGLIPEEESEEESVELFPGPEEAGTKPAPIAVTEKSKTTKKPSLLTPKPKPPAFATPKKPTIGLIPEEESEEESEELFPEPAESGSSTTNNITKPSTQKTSSTTKIPTTKFLIQPESEEESEEELFVEPVETTKSTAASTKKLTTQAAAKQTTKRQEFATTRGTTKQQTPSTEPEIVSTKITSSTSLGTTSAMIPETTPSMTSIESSTAIVAPSKATTSTRPSSPKTTKKFRKRPGYVSTITKVQKPITTKSTTITSQISTMQTQISTRPTKPKPTVQSTTELKTLSSTAVLPEPSTEAMTVQTIATSTSTTSQTIPITLATSTLQVPTTSYPTQTGPIKTSQVPTTSEILPEVLPTLPMIATTQKAGAAVLNQMQVPTEVGTTPPYQTMTQSSATETTSKATDETMIETSGATNTGTTLHSTTEIARETTEIYTTPQMTEMASSTTTPSTTETVYTQKPSSLETTTILSSTEAEKTTSSMKETIATVKTTEAATEEATTRLPEMLTQVSTQSTAPVTTAVTKMTAATEAVEATTTMEKVTVTPIYIEMTTPSIISTETSTIPTSLTVKHTTADTFLVDRKSTKPTSRRPTGEVNEDDIFGIALPPSTTTSRPPIKSVPKGFDDLFDNSEEARNAKIIFSDFYEASTSPTPTQSQPLTSQSYETSISFKVNKRDRTQFQPSTANPRSDTLQTPEQVLHHQTLQLVNHARSIEYLNQDGSDKTIRSPKYKRRRGYVSRTKKLVSKRRRISRDRTANSQGT
nr:unnamed protein product [Callosobruchus chinensis]